ncbi:MAG: hypothetical protein P4L35_20220 [Ignavibacteriaceae bacterium]|nr:hypothetical protein [Ignavibacteriaceae bacterium]
MKKTLAVFYLSLFLLLGGCAKNNNVTNPLSKSTGGISFKIDHTTVPSGVFVITATLTRANFTTITKNLNLLSDSTGDVTIPAIQVGTWHLKLDAKDSIGTILYTGETDVNVQENIVVQLNLTLNPVSSGKGSIYIFVTWGTANFDQWIDFGGNPILTRTNNPSLPGHVSSGKVLYDNGIYKMWYEAIYNGGVASIWYAESQNGISWNTIGSVPVLSKGAAGSWDDYSVIPAAVMKVNNQYRLYYWGYRGFTDMVHVGLALSMDGINWVKNSSPVITANSQYYVVGLTDIVKKDSTYLAYFFYNTSRSSDNNKIGMATSYDGITWTMYSGNPVLSASINWEGGSISYPTLIYENNLFKMVYSNAITENKFGMAVSTDGFNFIKQSAPFFSNTGTVKNYNQIAYPYYRKLNNEYRIYYTGQAASGELSINLLRIPNM